MQDIFLSYNTHDAVHARRLRDALEAVGYSVFWDRETILPGQDFTAHIDEALRSAHCVVVLLSHKAVASEWVQRELNEAVRLHKLVPARLQAMTPPQLPLAVRDLTVADLSDWQGESEHQQFAMLMRSVVALIARRRSEPPSGRTGLEDRYELVSPLGQGSFGIVYRARDLKTHDEVALKVLHNRFRDASRFDRYLADDAAVAQQNSPHLLTIRDTGRLSDGTPYIVRDLLEGSSLSSSLLEAPFSVERIIHVVDQVCETLAAVHRCDVIHRALTPSNIFLCDPPRLTHAAAQAEHVYVLDVGSARLLGAMSSVSTGVSLGAPCYMSPEQCRGENCDQRSDVYALGVIMYEMVAGRVPFHDDDSWQVLKAHVEQAPPPHKKTLPELDRLIARALSKAPADRYQSIDELRASLAVAHKALLSASRSPKHFGEFVRHEAPASDPETDQVWRTPPPVVPQTTPPQPRLRWSSSLLLTAAVALLATLLVANARRDSIASGSAPSQRAFACGDQCAPPAAWFTAPAGLRAGTQISLSWRDLEPSPGQFQLSSLRASLQIDGPVKLLNVRIPDRAELGAPSDLQGVAFNDPIFQQRLYAFVDKLIAELDDTVQYLSIGSQVESFVRAHPEQVDAYALGLRELFDHIVLLKDSLKVGVMLRLTTSSDPEIASALRRLSRTGDVLFVSYRPLSPDAPTRDLPRMLELAAGRSVVIQEMAFPARTHSEEAAQARLVDTLFTTWRSVESRLPYISWLYLNDLDAAACGDAQSLLARDSGSSALLSSDEVSATCAMGLRHADGTPKLAFERLRTLIAP